MKPICTVSLLTFVSLLSHEQAHAGAPQVRTQAPGFYRNCGYEEFGSIEGYPAGVTRHWFTKAL